MNLTGLMTGLLGTGMALDSVLRAGLLWKRFRGPRRFAAPASLSEAGGVDAAIILIAARDEAGVIGDTVRALGPMLDEWPGARVQVVADHCVDQTADEARQAGAVVSARMAGRMGKGAVIDWWLREQQALWKKGRIIIILDADSRIEPGTLAALRGTFAAGADVAQAFVKPVADTRSGRLAGGSEVLMQSVDDMARSASGWQVPLRGTGMAFRAGLLAELTPRLHTLAEDLELDVLIAARKIRVAFVPDAVLLDPKPMKSDGAARQRARWLRGQLQVLRDYRREALRALATGGASAWFLLPLLFMRPKVLFIALRMAALLFSLLMLAIGTAPAILFSGLAGFALTGLLLDSVYYLAAAPLMSDPQKYLRDLLAAPRYALMWVFSMGLMLVRRGWLRAGR
ncbi:MAG: glycosyltransferase family 2 protein [Blastocatellia bacterium]